MLPYVLVRVTIFLQQTVIGNNDSVLETWSKWIGRKLLYFNTFGTMICRKERETGIMEASHMAAYGKSPVRQYWIPTTAYGQVMESVLPPVPVNSRFWSRTGQPPVRFPGTISPRRSAG